MLIRFENVSLTFGDTPVLRDISFTLGPDTRMALVGGSGAGKSSITGLLTRKTDPTNGTIYIDDRPFPEYQLQSVLRHVGVILQRAELISGTVRENITLSVHEDDMSKITDDVIWSILDMISPSFRARFSTQGLDTLVGKQGMQLSGGEQQRLCVARALLKQPEVLIVDEATASLDSETEQVVQQGIDTAMAQNISALVVAHRFSTLRNCNRFVVLKKLDDCEPGESQIEIICDSAEEAYERSPTFRKLSDLQGFRP